MSKVKSSENCAVLRGDNVSSISMMQTYENSKRGKHLEIRYQYIKDFCRRKITSTENISVVFKKVLGKVKFRNRQVRKQKTVENV